MLEAPREAQRGPPSSLRLTSYPRRKLPCCISPARGGRPFSGHFQQPGTASSPCGQVLAAMISFLEKRPLSVELKSESEFIC